MAKTAYSGYGYSRIIFHNQNHNNQKFIIFYELWLFISKIIIPY